MIENLYQAVSKCSLEFQVVSVHVAELKPPTAIVLVITFIQMKSSDITIKF